MRWRYWKLSGVLAASLLFASTALADEAQQKAKPDAAKRAAHLLKQLDANGDGEITADEVPDEKSRMFKRLVRAADANDDGKIDGAELLAGISPKNDAVKNAAFGPGDRGPRGRRAVGEFRPDPEQMFAHADANNDGKVDVEEMVAAHRERIERMMKHADTNGDGALDREEFAKMAAHMGPGRGGPPGPPQAGERRGPRDGDVARRPGGPDGPPRGERRGGPPRGPRDGDGPPRRLGSPGGPPQIDIFVVIDTDKDGVLSKEEISAAAEAIAQLDHNNDGVIDMPEAMGHPPFGDRFARRGPDGRGGPPDGRRGPPEGRRGPEERRGPPPEGRRGPPDGRGPEGRFGPGGEGFSPGRIVDRIMQADADGDGKLTRDEAPERLAAHFDDVDTNGDDVIDRAELRQMIEQRMREHGPDGRRGPPNRGPRGPGGRGPRGDGPAPDPAPKDDTAAADAPADAV